MELNRYAHVVQFGQTYLIPPMFFDEAVGVQEVFPNEARLRGFTYYTPIYIDVMSKTFQLDVNRRYNPQVDEPVHVEVYDHEFLCFIPIVVRSKFCRLNSNGQGLNNGDIINAGECVSDPGGYFIINGSEKVIVA